jgi:hypothetical protein
MNVQCGCVCAGLSTFVDRLRGRNIVIHTDNTIAEHGMGKGRARSFDHTAVVHSVWYTFHAHNCYGARACALLSRTMALEMGVALYIKRVPTKENLSDDPSRERYGLLRRMGVGGCIFCLPVLLQECAWACRLS